MITAQPAVNCIKENKKMSMDVNADIEQARRDAEQPELNCHVDIYDGGLRFSYSGKADELFQKGANVAVSQLWDKLSLIFMNKKWNKKWKVKDLKEFFDKYTPSDIFNTTDLY